MFDREHRTVSIGTLLAMSLIAFEGLAIVTIAPEIAADLEGLGFYGWIFSAFLLAQVVGPPSEPDSSRTEQGSRGPC